MIIQFTTVCFVTTPLAYYFAFEWFEHEEFVNPMYPKEAQTFPGMGVTGLWVGLVIGYCFQISMF